MASGLAKRDVMRIRRPISEPLLGNLQPKTNHNFPLEFGPCSGCFTVNILFLEIPNFFDMESFVVESFGLEAAAN